MLELCNVSKIYGEGNSAIKALDNVSLKIDKGEQVALVGKSGSGKSTLLNIIGAMDTPTEGKVFIAGEELSGKEKKLAKHRRVHIGFVFQYFHLLPVLSVKENILLPVHINHANPDKARFDLLVKRLGIADQIDKYPEQLSGGQKQRVAIARALIHNPGILLADEPTGNLDSETSEDVVRLLLECAREFGQTLIVVTHDKEVASHFSKVITLKDGKLL